MVDPSATVTVGQVISSLKDGAFLIGICVAGWKARGIIQPAVDFFSRCNKHMDTMEHGMRVILENHLAHIEKDLQVISGRRYQYVDVNESPITPVYEAYAAEEKSDIIKES